MNPESSINAGLLQTVETSAERGAETEPLLEPRIWVASLTDHEHGQRHGAWISAEQDLRGIRSDIDTMLALSPTARRRGEAVWDWAIFHAADFGLWPVHPHIGLQRISNVGLGIAEHGAPFAAWASIVTDDEQLADFSAAYHGHYDSLHAYLEQLINDLGYNDILAEHVPAKLQPWVKLDIGATAEDLLDGGDLQVVKAPQGGLWVFNG